MPLIDYSKINVTRVGGSATGGLSSSKKGRLIDYDSINVSPSSVVRPAGTKAWKAPKPMAIPKYAGQGAMAAYQSLQTKAIKDYTLALDKYNPQKYNPEVTPVAPLPIAETVKRWSAEAAAARKATPEIGQRLLEGMSGFTKIIQPNITNESGRNAVADFAGSVLTVAAGVYAVKSLLGALSAGTLYLKTPRTAVDRETTTLFPSFENSHQAQEYVVRLQQTNPAAADKFKSDLITLLEQTIAKDSPTTSNESLRETASRMYDFLVTNGQAGSLASQMYHAGNGFEGSFASVGEKITSATTALTNLVAAVSNPQTSLMVAEQAANQLAKTGMLQLLPSLAIANRSATIPMPAGLVHSTAPAIPMGGGTLPVAQVSTEPAAVAAEPYVPRDKFQVEHPLLERPQPAVPGVKTTKSMDTIMAEEEAAGRKLETTPRAVDKTIPAIDVTKANLVDVTAKVDLPSVQVKFPSADKVVLDTKRRTVMFMHGTTPLEAIAVDKPQLRDWYGIEGAKLLGEITQPLVVAQVAPPLSKMETTYPRIVGEVVDGRIVREDIPNQDSIDATIDHPTILHGIREVQMSMFDAPPVINKKTTALANAIKESGEINPLIVAVDKNGPYILEGANRYDALKILGAKSIPAMVVLDNDSLSAPDLSTTPQKGTATTISNQKTSISTSTPITPRVGTQTGSGEVKWGKWIDAVGSRRTSGVGTGQVDTIKTPVTYRLGSGTTPVRAYAPTVSAERGISGPFIPETGKRLELKGDSHTYYLTRLTEDEAAANGLTEHSTGLASYRPFSVIEARSGNLIGQAGTVKDAIGRAQETINNNKAIYDGKVEEQVVAHGEIANPASVPAALITSTSAPAAAPSLGNASTLPAGQTSNVAPTLTTKPPWEMTQAEWDAVPDPATIKPLKAGDRIVYHVLLKKGSGMTGKETVADALKNGIRRESTNTGIWVSLDKPVNDFGDMFVIELPESDLHIMNQQEAIVEKRNILPSDVRAFYPSFKADPRDTNYTRLDTSKFENGDTRQDWIDVAKQNGLPVSESPSTALLNTPAHGLIDYSTIELNGTTSVTSPAVLKSVSNTGKGFSNYVQNTAGTKDTSLSPFAKIKEKGDLQALRFVNAFGGLMKTPAGAEWMTMAIEADEVLREEYARPFAINEAGERVYVEGEFAPAILNRYLKASDVDKDRYLQDKNGVALVSADGKKIKNPNYGKAQFGIFLQHLQRAGIPIENTLGLGSDKTNLAQQHIADARMSLDNFQKNDPKLFQAYMAQAQEIGDANARLLPEFYKEMISPETYANDKANPHYYVSLSAGRTDIFDREGIAPLERTHGLTDLDKVVEPLPGLLAVYVDAIRALGINNAKREAVRANKNSEVATTELSDSVVHLKENGVDRAYDVHDTNVTESIHNLTFTKEKVTTVEKWLGTAPTTALRLFATGLNPAFGLFNIVRDIIQSFLTVPFTPRGLIKGTVRAFKNPGLSQWFESYRDPMMSKGTRAIDALKMIVEILTYPNEILESWTRSGIAESIIDRGGTYLDQLHGYYNSTGFFALHGTFFNSFIASCIPFTRATIAVVRAAYHNVFFGLPIGDKGGTFSGKQGAEKMAGRHLATIIFTIISALAWKEAGKEKEYKLLRDRASYFYFPLPGGGAFKLPVPIGFQPTKAIVDSLFGYKSDPLDVARQTLNVLPGLESFMLPPGFALFLQLKFNINFFTGAAIDARADTPAANPLEAGIMKATGWTEERAAFVVRAFFADIPSQFQYVFDMVATGSSTQAFPLTKRFIVKDPTTSSNAAVDDFYALVDAVKHSKNPALERYVNGRASDIGKLLKNAKLYPADAKVYMTTATNNIIATFAVIAENPSDYGIKKYGPFSWRPSGNYEELAP